MRRNIQTQHVHRNPPLHGSLPSNGNFMTNNPSAHSLQAPMLLPITSFSCLKTNPSPAHGVALHRWPVPSHPMSCHVSTLSLISSTHITPALYPSPPPCTLTPSPPRIPPRTSSCPWSPPPRPSSPRPATAPPPRQTGGATACLAASQWRGRIAVGRRGGGERGARARWSRWR